MGGMWLEKGEMWLLKNWWTYKKWFQLKKCNVRKFVVLDCYVEFSSLFCVKWYIVKAWASPKTTLMHNMCLSGNVLPSFKYLISKIQSQPSLNWVEIESIQNSRNNQKFSK